MVLKGYSPKTQKSYLYAVEKVARHFGRPPDTIDVGELESYFLYLLTERRMASASVRLIVNGMRFLNNQVLQRPARDFLVRYPKRAQRIPELLTRDEVHRILSYTGNLKHHALLATCYAAAAAVPKRWADMTWPVTTAIIKRRAFGPAAIGIALSASSMPRQPGWTSDVKTCYPCPTFIWCSPSRIS